MSHTIIKMKKLPLLILYAQEVFSIFMYRQLWAKLLGNTVTSTMTPCVIMLKPPICLIKYYVIIILLYVKGYFREFLLGVNYENWTTLIGQTVLLSHNISTV